MAAPNSITGFGVKLYSDFISSALKEKMPKNDA